MDVHQLLSEDGVDARMLETTRAKRADFDEYARRSDLAASTPDAIAFAWNPRAIESDWRTWDLRPLR